MSHGPLNSNWSFQGLKQTTEPLLPSSEQSWGSFDAGNLLIQTLYFSKLSDLILSISLYSCIPVLFIIHFKAQCFQDCLEGTAIFWACYNHWALSYILAHWWSDSKFLQWVWFLLVGICMKKLGYSNILVLLVVP